MGSVEVPAAPSKPLLGMGGDRDVVAGSCYDVLVAGAGLVGLSLASRLAEDGRSVALVDRAVVASPPPVAEDDWDGRVYAISPGSVAFLSSLGAWQAVPRDRIAPVEAMVVEGDRGAVLRFSAYELGERALAWIVEERTLKSALVALAAKAGVAVHAPCALASLAFGADACTLRCHGDAELRARLLVGADGLRSHVRESAGIVAETKPYGQTAVVANFRCERAHLGRAFQWFLDGGGVLAWLPLPGRRVSMVWSAPDLLAGELLALPAATLAERVAARGRHCLGALEVLTPAAGFPLNLSRLPTTIGRRVALVGDAAHGIHPLAGQGVNLGFGDAEALAAVLRDSGPVTDAGEVVLLERFARRRKAPVLAMQLVTDGLARLFGTTLPLVRAARNLGLTAVDGLPPAKRLLAHSALR